MRHLIGILLAVVMAGVLFFAGAWGYLRLTALTTPLSRLPAGGGSCFPITTCSPRWSPWLSPACWPGS